MIEGTPIKTVASCPMAVSIAQFIQFCFAFRVKMTVFGSGKDNEGDWLFSLRRCRRGSREIGIPHVGGTFPISISLFFPDLKVIPAIVNRLTARVVLRQFVPA